MHTKYAHQFLMYTEKVKKYNGQATKQKYTGIGENLFFHLFSDRKQIKVDVILLQEQGKSLHVRISTTIRCSAPGC
jgi:hypothetical protein